MKVNSFRPIPELRGLRRNHFHRQIAVLDNTMAGSLRLEREDQLASQEIAREIKEVFRLKFEVGPGLRQIARSCSIGLGSPRVLQRADAAKITWPLGPEWDDDRLEATLFGGPPRSPQLCCPCPITIGW